MEDMFVVANQMLETANSRHGRPRRLRLRRRPAGLLRRSDAPRRPALPYARGGGGSRLGGGAAGATVAPVFGAQACLVDSQAALSQIHGRGGRCHDRQVGAHECRASCSGAAGRVAWRCSWPIRADRSGSGRTSDTGRSPRARWSPVRSSWRSLGESSRKKRDTKSPTTRSPILDRHTEVGQARAGVGSPGRLDPSTAVSNTY